jgi:hypothetical protein
MNTAFLLGAGFSKWAADVPVAAQLFDFLILASIRDSPKLERIRGMKEEWDAAHPEGDSEQFIAHVFERGLQRDRATLSWYIARRLNEPFLWTQHYGGVPRRRTLSIDETYKRHLPGLDRVRDFLAAHGLAEATGIVTTNYDLLVEYALGSGGFHYGDKGEQLHGPGAHPMRREAVTLSGTLPLAKLHGSISWDSDSRYTDGRRALTGNALIVAPVPEKIPPPALRGAWRLAASILSRCECVVVFGFAFNPYDVAVLEMLSDAGRAVRSVELFDIAPPLKRAQDVWPAAEVVPFLPPAPSEAEARSGEGDLTKRLERTDGVGLP